jgi:hypothetical protein
MMTVCFQNKEEIDVRGLLTFGASAKEKANAIGYFGTGLKYAIAVLLRHKCDITIYIGLSEIRITSKSMRIRNDTFDVVYLNDKEAPYTLDLGKNWKLWMAYRELYANAMDEQDWTVGRDLFPKAGYTTVVVDGKAFLDLHNQQDGDSVFLKTEPMFVLEGMEVHPSATQSRWLYYRGIRAFLLDKPAMYNYNITNEVLLTEDRTIPSLSSFFKTYAKAIGQCDHPSLIRQVLEADQRYFESTIDYHWWNYTPGEVFNQIVARYISSGTSFNSSAKSKYRIDKPEKAAPHAVQWETIPMEQRRKVWAAVRFWQKLGFHITREMITVTDEYEGTSTKRGEALRGHIYLAESALNEDMRRVAGLIYKFWAQTKPKVGNVKEEDLLIDTVVEFGERLLGLQQAAA